jgi:Glyoxalase-like domain
MVEALERNDVATVRELWFERELDWSPDEWIPVGWHGRLTAFAGPHRRIVEGWRVHDEMVRFRLAGDDGEAFATVIVNDQGLVRGLSVASEIRQGGFWIVLGCREREDEVLRAMYERLVDTPLGFGDGGAEPPRWPDPAYPQQMHLDVVVRDPDAAEAEVLALGATKLRDSGEFRVYADQAGHPFCLYASTDGPDPKPGRLGVLTRVVIDCPDPAVLATFWSQVLPYPERVEASSDRIVIARDDGTLPMIALQRVDDYRAPTWPDPPYPEQVHFDIGYDDRAPIEALALRLGARKIPPQGGSCPVYADPAGHPFCLCMTGE